MTADIDDRLDATLDAKLDALRAELRRLGRVVVAFSGGADSAFLAAVAASTLGIEAAPAVTAVSPSLAGSEGEDCRRLAAEWGLRWLSVESREMERAAYRINDVDRCFHCKDELMAALRPIVSTERAIVVLGVNTDDLTDHRPGQRAAAAAGAEFPLVAAGFSKQDVRAASRRLGLRTWNKPAAACLASRIPTGTPVTVELLSTIDRAEAAVRALGFGQLRVRHHGDTARLEVDSDDLALAVAQRRQIVDALRPLGYRYVTLDLEGFRSGSTNGITPH
jgi:pyridinium-3,5-biscarboxylic acid mononucleotide sulfurtransferase